MTARRAHATVAGERIRVETKGPFEEMLAACKAVPGGRFAREPRKHWHYPLSLDTCHTLRRVFGSTLLVSPELSAWYRATVQQAEAAAHLTRQGDAPLPRLAAAHAPFWAWLRGYQRAGAAWMVDGYRGCGLVADKPGVGKTPETLAALIEGQVTGPVLIICPKASVNLVWGKELRDHLPAVPRYLCAGTWEQREAVLDRFAADMRADPTPLRVVVIVAEMLRVDLGPPCLTKGGNKVPGMCPRGPHHDEHHTLATVPKKKFVPIGFWYPQLFDTNLLQGGWSQIIIDESHKLLGSLTISKGNLMGRGLRYLPERAGRRYALSGTPFGKAGRVEGLFGTLHWLWPDEFPSYWRWAESVFDIEQEVVNRRGLIVKKIIGLKGLGPDATPDEEFEAYEQLLRSLGPRILRRTKEETLEHLPPKTYSEVVCEMVPAQARQYRQLVEHAEFQTPGGIIMANGALALLTRSRQLANGALTMVDGKARFTPDSGKLARLREALDVRGILERTAGEKIVVATAFNEFSDVIAAELTDANVPFFQYDARQSATAREAIVQQWQRGPIGGGDEPRVLLLNSTAGGISITLDMADEMHILDELADPGANEQLEDRLHRASRIHKVMIFYYRTVGSLDYERARNVEYRRRVQHAILDGSRGMVYVREMLQDALNQGKGNE